MHTCMHAYMHTCIHAICIHPYIHTTIQPYIHTYIYIYIQYLNPGYVTKPSFGSSQVDDHHAEKSFIFDARKDTPLVDVAGHEMRGTPMENHGTLRKQWENQPKTLKFDS